MYQPTEKERFLLNDLRSQEKLCIDKYTRYEGEAKDSELKNLFSSIKQTEQKHYDSLGQVLEGNIPQVSAGNPAGEDYNPKATYVGSYNQQDKDNDSFLCTDAITMEKYVAGAYNFQLFQFGNPEMRRLLNDIETEEQNHAEQMYKYKTVNGMTN